MFRAAVYSAEFSTWSKRFSTGRLASYGARSFESLDCRSVGEILA